MLVRERRLYAGQIWKTTVCWSDLKDDCMLVRFERRLYASDLKDDRMLVRFERRLYAGQIWNATVCWSGLKCDCMLVRFERRPYACQVWKATVCWSDLKDDCMLVRFEMRLYAGQVWNATDCKSSLKGDCMLVRFQRRLHASQVSMATVCLSGFKGPLQCLPRRWVGQTHCYQDRTTSMQVEALHQLSGRQTPGASKAIFPPPPAEPGGPTEQKGPCHCFETAVARREAGHRGGIGTGSPCGSLSPRAVHGRVPRHSHTMDLVSCLHHQQLPSPYQAV